MDVARINLSHGSREEHEGLTAAVREAAEAAGRAVGLMADLPGPKVRLGELAGGAVELDEGAAFTLRAGDGPGDAAGATTSYSGLAGDLEPGDRVLLSDGIVELRAEDADDEGLRTEVVRGGIIRSRASVNVPADRLGLSAISERDEEHVEWIRRAGVDLVSQSFVRRAEEVRALRELLREAPALVVAKIETAAALADRDRILEVADAIMVARGDLGVELPPEEIPVLQKDLVDGANRAGKPAIVATQMLESMIESPRPTRAEAGDVAGAAFDGAAAILLSAETAIGAFPAETVRTADRILRVAQASRFSGGAAERNGGGSEAHAIAHAARAVVEEGEALAVACFTRTGRTAKLLSAVRLPVPVYAFSDDEGVVRRLTVCRGVRPIRSELPGDTDAMIDMMDRGLAEGALAQPGERVVMVASAPVGGAHTNLLKIHRMSA